MKRIRYWAVRGVAVLLLASTACLHVSPGWGHRGALPPATSEQSRRADELRQTVQAIAGDIGPRCAWSRMREMDATASWIEGRLAGMGYAVDRQTYTVHRNRDCVNLSVERRGGKRPDEVVVMGAHYDTVCESPGANDNTSAVAALLEVARDYRERTCDRSIRFVFFTNEEHPYGSTPAMGSYRYAQRSHERGEKIVAMISLDEIGYYDDRPGSQKYVFPLNLFYPSAGNFLLVVSDMKNVRLLDRVVRSFRRGVKFPCEGLGTGIRDAARSDHWSFWQFGYPAVLITDTADFRYPHYHRPTDTPDKVDYDRLARVVDGLIGVVDELSNVE